MKISESSKKYSETMEIISGGQDKKPALKGRKTSNRRMLEDKTNSSGQVVAQWKKRKQFANVQELEDVQEKVITSVNVQQTRLGSARNSETLGVVKKDLTKILEQETQMCKQGTQTQRQPINVIFPSDVVRSTRDGHLFPREYILPVTRTIDITEKNLANLFPSPNYFEKQNDIRPKMRTILFTWMTEVHLRFMGREVVL